MPTSTSRPAAYCNARSLAAFGFEDRVEAGGVEQLAPRLGERKEARDEGRRRADGDRVDHRVESIRARGHGVGGRLRAVDREDPHAVEFRVWHSDVPDTTTLTSDGIDDGARGIVEGDAAPRPRPEGRAEECRRSRVGGTLDRDDREVGAA